MPAATAPRRLDHPYQHMRPKWRYAGRMPAALGFGSAAQYINLLPTGYTEGLLIRVSGQYDIAVGGSAVNVLAPYFIFKNIKIQPPGGQLPWNIDGWNTKMLNFTDRDFAPFITGADAGAVAPSYVNGVTRNGVSDEAFPNVANTANQKYNLFFFIPCHRSSYDRRGMLPTGRLQFQLWLTPAALADLFATPANVTNQTMTVDVFQMVSEPPPNVAGIGPVDTGWIIVTDEYQDPFGAPAVGDNRFELVNKGAYLDFLQTLILNGALDSADSDLFSLRLDSGATQSWDVDHIDTNLWYFYQRGLQGRDTVKGVILIEYDRLIDADGSAGIMDPHFMLSMGEWLIVDDTINKVVPITHISGGVAGTSHIRAVTRRFLPVG